MTETPSLSLPWQVSRSELLRAAEDAPDGAAVCAFVIDDAIPRGARAGYAALVIAHARADEPVHIERDGTAILLIREGGTAAGEVVARRVLQQMRRLQLDTTLRAGVAAVRGDADAAARTARETAAAEPGGSVGVAAG